MEKRPINLVWFKRDLRLQDHAPLATACADELPVLMFYVFEPSVMANADSDLRHWRFVWQSLQNLNRVLPTPSCINIFLGEVKAVLEYLSDQYDIRNIFSHQETGNALTFERDRTVAKWCKNFGINWKQFPSNGIQRGLKSKKNWYKSWLEHVSQPTIEPDIQRLRAIYVDEHPFMLQSFQQLFRGASLFLKNFQPGGPTPGSFYLQTFLNERGIHYEKYLANPNMSRISCSRLSPYLAHGNLSVRQVWQATSQRIEEAYEFVKPLEVFKTRLIWNSSFIQKFEMQPSLEFENMNTGFDSFRKQVDEKLLEAWKGGLTGYPLVDACMRCLQETGYLNFRMRAMLVSFLTHHLWHPWQSGVHHLAKLFLDYEPGIHYCQFQLQAGVTGINTLHIYNPVKQSKEQDKEGEFIQKWLPELRHLPVTFLHEPWKMDITDQRQLNCVIGNDYPARIIDIEVASRYARETLNAIKKNDDVRVLNTVITKKFSEPDINEETDK